MRKAGPFHHPVDGVVVRMTAAAVLTAAVGAVFATIVDRLADPGIPDTGSLLWRAAFSFSVPLFFILAGMTVIGVSAAFGLHLLGFNSASAYGAV